MQTNWIHQCFHASRLQLWTMGCPFEQTFVEIVLCTDPNKQKDLCLLKRSIETFILSKNPEWASLYAFWVLNKRFYEGKDVIAQSKFWKWYYENVFNISLDSNMNQIL